MSSIRRRRRAPLLAGALGVIAVLSAAAITHASSGSQGQAPQFQDATAASQIRFVHTRGNHGPATILEEAGPGVCVADFDGDGFVDIYFVNGRDRNGGDKVRNALYRNNGDGTFTDVTEK